MRTTIGCMKRYVSGLVIVRMLALLGGIAFGGMVLSVPHVTWADGTAEKTAAASSKSMAPTATYDESQPGADDPRVKEGFAAYQDGDFKKAYDIWLPLAEAGNAEAQFRVGRLFSFGDGVDIDIGEAIEWYKKASLKEHIKATYNLGVIYGSGKLGFVDYVNSFKHYNAAAQKCHLSAQNNLGVLFASTAPPDRDFAAAHKWLFIASIRGHEGASETNKLLLNRFSNIDEYLEGRKRAQEWLERHPCDSE